MATTIYQRYRCSHPDCSWLGQRWLKGLPTMSAKAEGKRHVETHADPMEVVDVDETNPKEG